MSANGGNGGGTVSVGGGGGGGGRISITSDNVNKLNITLDAYGGKCVHLGLLYLFGYEVCFLSLE